LKTYRGKGNPKTWRLMENTELNLTFKKNKKRGRSRGALLPQMTRASPRRKICMEGTAFLHRQSDQHTFYQVKLRKKQNKHKGRGRGR